MKSFDMQLPKTLGEAVGLLPDDSDGTAVLLAGGQDLLTELKERLVEPDRLVNLKSVPGLDTIEDAGGGLSIGALVTLQDLADHARTRTEFAALSEAAESVGSPQIRSAGTVGGNLNQRPRCWYYRHSHAPCLKKPGGTECFSYEGKNKYNAILGGGPSYIVHPSDLAPALIALGASVTLVGTDGERTVALEDFFTLPTEGDVKRETVLSPNEILTRVNVPKPRAGMKSTYLKFKERGSYDFALGAVALCLWFDDGKVTEARVVLGAVAPKPWRSKAAEEALVGKTIDAATTKAAGEAAVRGAQPLSDNGYKIPLTKGLLKRALQKLG